MLKEYTKRMIVLMIGLMGFGLGNAFGVIAGNVGTNAWNTFTIGLSGVMGFSFGTANLAISVLVLAVDIIFKGKIGIGTILNALVVAWFSDIFIVVLGLLPQGGQVLGVVYTLIGQLIIAFSTVLYMKPSLGCGPRDTLLLIISRPIPKAPIGVVKFLTDVTALVCGLLLGAPFGIGTVLVMLLQASFLQFACKVCRYEPRDAVHENLADTFRRIKGRA